jgi:hypothetical protein
MGHVPEKDTEGLALGVSLRRNLETGHCFGHNPDMAMPIAVSLAVAHVALDGVSEAILDAFLHAGCLEGFS